MTEDVRRLRIHGDNIVECERALAILVAAIGGTCTLAPASSSISPSFRILPTDVTWRFYDEISVELLPGHGRWGIDIAGEIRQLGSPLRENADAVVTSVEYESESILLAFEFCGALPAGNNAWQRHGRALGFARAGVPYLIVAELGGSELSADRHLKASRTPNPAVPAALLLLSAETGVPVLPVYEAAASAPTDLEARFAAALGRRAVGEYMAAAVLGEDVSTALAEVRRRAETMVTLLAGQRRSKDALSAQDWSHLLKAPNDRMDVYEESGLTWKVNGLTGKVRKSNTAPRLVSAFARLGPTPLGAGSLRFAYLGSDQRVTFADDMRLIYGAGAEELAEWIAAGTPPLVLVLVTGFKPGGEDSRPDRGLAPLARMLAGQGADVLALVWGPAPAALAQQIQTDLAAAATRNGLVESITATCDALILDGPDSPPAMLLLPRAVAPGGREGHLIGAASAVARLGEHDVDTATHLLFTQPRRSPFFEGLCNPPGGDWSGISLLDANGREVRWTSLPRVSRASKRPDHVIQIKSIDSENVLAIESKSSSRSLEASVGPALIRYIDDLTKTPPNVVPRSADGQEFGDLGRVDASWKAVFSAGMFLWKDDRDLHAALIRSGCHLVGGWDFSDQQRPVLHLEALAGSEFLLRQVRDAAASSDIHVKVEEH